MNDDKFLEPDNEIKHEQIVEGSDVHKKNKDRVSAVLDDVARVMDVHKVGFFVCCFSFPDGIGGSRSAAPLPMLEKMCEAMISAERNAQGVH
jgi:hypothetical protein